MSGPEPRTPRDLAAQFGDGERGPRLVAIVVAVLLHLVALAVYVDSDAAEPISGDQVYAPKVKAFRPAPPPPPPRPQRVVQQRQDLAPIPDPEPDEPEPVLDPSPLPLLDAPDLALDFIGDPSAPPSDGSASGSPGPIYPGVEGLVLPKLIPETQVQAGYPDEARRTVQQGQVALLCVVRSTGDVDDCKVLHERPQGLRFAQSAIEAAVQWKYIPGRLDGRPVDVYMTVTVGFSLGGR